MVDDGHIGTEHCEREEHCPHSRQPQLPPHPVERERESPYVQTSHNEHVKNARLLKIRSFRSVDKTPVTQKHRPQDASDLRSARKQLIDLVAQPPSGFSENRSNGRCWRADPFDQLRRP